MLITICTLETVIITILYYRKHALRDTNWNLCYISLVAMACSCCMLADSASTYLPNQQTVSEYLKWIGPIVFECSCYYTPIVLMFVIQWLISIKYIGYMEQLTAEMRNKHNPEKIDWIVINYLNLHRDFETDYHVWLRRSLETYMISEIVYVWVITFTVLKLDEIWRGFELCWVICCCVFYLVPAARMNRAFHEFKSTVTGRERTYLDQQEHLHQYNHLRICLMESPLLMAFGNRIEISFSNAFRLFVVFAVGKSVSYAVHYLY